MPNNKMKNFFLVLISVFILCCGKAPDELDTRSRTIGETSIEYLINNGSVGYTVPKCFRVSNGHFRFIEYCSVNTSNGKILSLACSDDSSSCVILNLIDEKDLKMQ